MSAFTSLYRSLTRHRLFAALNIGGLALGIAAFIVLFLFVRFETGFDRVLPGSDRIWMVQEHYTMPGYPEVPNPWTMGGELEQLRGDFPDLVGTRFNNTGATIRQGGIASAEDFTTVDRNYFDIFRFPVVAGDPGRTIADPDGIVITEKIARKYFGSQSAIGRTLPVTVGKKTYLYRVGAVLRDMPADVTFKADMFAFLAPDRFANPNFFHWGSTSLATFVQFPDDAAAHAFEGKLDGFLERHAYPAGNVKRGQYRQSLRPLSAHHLYAPGDRAIVTTLGVVGVLTLLIAVVNYINLATARAGLRAREVAMRKVLGGTRRSLIVQFLGEAVATVALAALIGLALAELALPFVNAIGGTTLAIHYGGTHGILPPLFALVLVIGLLAGLYPAFALSRYQPASVLASARAPGGGKAGARLRQGLVIVQFAIAIAFAIGTGVMLGQTAHIRAADLGFKRDGLLLVLSFADDALQPAQHADLLAAFARLPGVAAVGVGQNAPGAQNNSDFGSYHRPSTPLRNPSAMALPVGAGYFQTYGTRLVAGRLFDRTHGLDDLALRPPAERQKRGANIVINETAARELGFKSPADAVGQVVSGDSNLTDRIIGVVADIRFRSPRDAVTSIVYYYDTGEINQGFAAIRYAGVDPQAMADRAQATWKRIAPAVPFLAKSAEGSLYDNYYKADAQRSRLFSIGAVLAIVIGCIGLYGLAAFDTARRVKEIGIRKTLGASTADVLKLLIGQFMRPVLLANLIAWPIAFVAMQRWLAGFDDRIALSPLFFVAASVAAILIATATIFGQAWRVARAEPARALRYE